MKTPSLSWSYLILVVLVVACGATNAAEPAVEPIAVAESWHIEYATHHVQGLCVTDESFWVSSVDRAAKRGYIYRVDRKSLKVAAERELVDGSHIHPGGMQLRDGVLWVPLAEYRPRSSTTVVCLDSETLQTKRSFAVADHLGAIAVAADGALYGANWDTKQFYVFDAEGKEQARFDNPTGVAYQDMEWHDGQLWAAGGLRLKDGRQSVIDVIDLKDRKLIRRFRPEGQTATVQGNFCREGFCLWKNACYLMPEDGPETRVYRLPLR